MNNLILSIVAAIFGMTVLACSEFLTGFYVVDVYV